MGRGEHSVESGRAIRWVGANNPLGRANNPLSRGEQSVGRGRTIRWVGANIPLSRGEESVGSGRTIRWVGANNPLGRGEHSVESGRAIRWMGANNPLRRGEYPPLGARTERAQYYIRHRVTHRCVYVGSGRCRERSCTYSILPSWIRFPFVAYPTIRRVPNGPEVGMVRILSPRRGANFLREANGMDDSATRKTTSDVRGGGSETMH